VTRDVLYGGTILEEAETKLTAESIENILNAENPVIRFEGEDERVRDHEMTESELNALDNVYKIASCNNLIERSIDDWEEANL
jgi:hypothetical protein